MMTTTKRFPRGTAFHEAGHAVVAWSLELPVRAIRISDDDASGGAEIGCANHLPFIDQLAICFAGSAAEDVFKEPAHRLASAADHARVLTLLKGLKDRQEGKVLRDLGRKRARKLLRANKSKVIRLAEQLVRRGRVGASEFLRLMQAG